MEQDNLEPIISTPEETLVKKPTKKSAIANIILFVIAVLIEGLCLYVLFDILTLTHSNDLSGLAILAILPYYIFAVGICIALTIPMVIIAICALATTKKRNTHVKLVVWLLPLISIIMIIFLIVALKF